MPHKVRRYRCDAPLFFEPRFKFIFLNGGGLFHLTRNPPPEAQQAYLPTIASSKHISLQVQDYRPKLSDAFQLGYRAFEADQDVDYPSDEAHERNNAFLS